jgi:hypothetical protein
MKPPKIEEDHKKRSLSFDSIRVVTKEEANEMQP